MKRIFITVVAAVLATSSAFGASIDWNGFGSAYFGQALDGDVRDTELRGGQTEIGRLSKIGLNVGSKLSDNFEVAAQFVGGGSGFAGVADPDWDFIVNWAFATWKPFDANLKVKMGRQLFPNWLAAEFSEVGALQPYRNLPGSIASVSIYKNFDGLLLDYGMEVGGGTLSFSTWAGTTDRAINTTTTAMDINVSRMLGVGITYTGDGFKVRTQASKQEVRLTATPMDVYGKGTTITAGASYDKHNIVVWAEYGTTIGDEGTKNVFTGGTYEFLEELSSYYALFGYRIGAFMPKVTYTYSNFEKSGLVQIAGEETIMTAGFNYQLNDSVVFKLDYQYGTIPEATETPGNGVSIQRDPNAAGDKTASSAVFGGVDFLF